MYPTLLFLVLIAVFHGFAGVGAHSSNPSIETHVERRQAPSSVDKSQVNDCLDPDTVQRNLRIQSCTPKNTLDANGNCGPLKDQSDGLQAAFCQIDVRWDYGPEVPLHQSCPCDDSKCQITSSKSIQISSSSSFSVGGNVKKRDTGGLGGLKSSDLVNVFNAGATWSYSTSYGNATAATLDKPSIAANKCGVWTFVPYFVTTCGTITWVTTGYSSTGPIDTSDQQTVGGWCQTTPYTDGQGSPIGETIFVARACVEQWPLGFCWQNPIYLQQGVSSNESIYQDYLEAHKDFDMSQPVESTPLIQCELNHAPYSEGSINPGCQAALPSGIPLSPAYVS